MTLSPPADLVSYRKILAYIDISFQYTAAVNAVSLVGNAPAVHRLHDNEVCTVPAQGAGPRGDRQAIRGPPAVPARPCRERGRAVTGRPYAVRRPSLQGAGPPR